MDYLEISLILFDLYRYAMRAIYIAKGSPLLPPSFTSIFDDLASSSLDVFFDPSSGLPNLPGVTIGIFLTVYTCKTSMGLNKIMS